MATKRKAASVDPSDGDSRARMVDAAIACILERGFYRASSNAIAERAGVTWGVIQYHFGTRERLMLAVIEEGTQRLVRQLSAARLEGETLQQRMEQYFGVLAGYYAAPEYLAFTQVLMNLGQDPSTSEETLGAIHAIEEPVRVQLERLTDELLDGYVVSDDAHRSLFFHVLRGMAISELMTRTLPEATSGSSLFPAHQRLLAEALTLLTETHSKGTLIRRRGRRRTA